MSTGLSPLFFADLSGFIALIFITAAAVMMFAKKRVLARTTKHEAFRKVHIAVAVLGGFFLVVHAGYFINAPITSFGISLGYLSTVVALVVWFTGYSFLDRWKYSLLYHGSLSLAAISLMVIHAVYIGFRFSTLTEAILLGIIVVLLFPRAVIHLVRISV